jgi:hypothetical protein
MTLPWDRLLRLAGVLQESKHANGEVLLKQGDIVKGLYIVRHGRLTVERDVEFDEKGIQVARRMTINTLIPKDVFGERSLMQPAGCTRAAARITAQTECTLLLLLRADFTPQMLSDGAFHEMRTSAKLYGNDDTLRRRYYSEQEWAKAKKRFCKSVLLDASQRRNSLVQHNPHFAGDRRTPRPTSACSPRRPASASPRGGTTPREATTPRAAASAAASWVEERRNFTAFS